MAVPRSARADELQVHAGRTDRTAAHGSLRLDGDISARSLSIEELRALGSVEVTWTHNDQAHVYTSVPIENVLRASGVDPGTMGPGVAASNKRAGWKFAVVITAHDGFQAAFSVAELFYGMGRTEAFVAFGENGEPIDASRGPLRLIVTSDGEASRSIRNLERLTVIDLRRLVSPLQHPR